jgi:hypothetical protein
MTYADDCSCGNIEEGDIMRNNESSYNPDLIHVVGEDGNGKPNEFYIRPAEIAAVQFAQGTQINDKPALHVSVARVGDTYFTTYGVYNPTADSVNTLRLWCEQNCASLPDNLNPDAKLVQFTLGYVVPGGMVDEAKDQLAQALVDIVNDGSHEGMITVNPAPLTAPISAEVYDWPMPEADELTLYKPE